jgi:predicted transcriptional regulator
MRWTSLFILTACLLLAGNTALAGVIYTWTDADGVRRYSNAQPPEGAENVKTIEEIQYEQQDTDQRRRDFNRMAEEAGKAADQHFEEQDEKKQQAAEAQRQRQQAEKSRQVAEEQANLQKQIEALQARGLGPNFSAGQRDNLIRQLQEQIDQLENSADRSSGD